MWAPHVGAAPPPSTPAPTHHSTGLASSLHAAGGGEAAACAAEAVLPLPSPPSPPPPRLGAGGGTGLPSLSLPAPILSPSEAERDLRTTTLTAALSPLPTVALPFRPPLNLSNLRKGPPSGIQLLGWGSLRAPPPRPGSLPGPLQGRSTRTDARARKELNTRGNKRGEEAGGRGLAASTATGRQRGERHFLTPRQVPAGLSVPGAERMQPPPPGGPPPASASLPALEPGVRNDVFLGMYQACPAGLSSRLRQTWG